MGILNFHFTRQSSGVPPLIKKLLLIIKLKCFCMNAVTYHANALPGQRLNGVPHCGCQCQAEKPDESCRWTEFRGHVFVLPQSRV